MRLRVDMRLPHDLAEVSAEDPTEVQRNRAVYRITEVISETPWGALYRAKKVFRNFDFKDRRIVEVDPDECLDVFVKTLLYPTLDKRAYILARREHARFEARQVLGCRKSHLIPESMGFLEVRNDDDAFTFPRAGQVTANEPVLICEAIQGESLVRWRLRDQPDLLHVFRILSEILELIASLHSEEMLLNNLGPSVFWIDHSQRVHLIATENVISRSKAVESRSLFPPQRYFRGFTAPELTEPDAPPSTESDLFGWASLAYFLLTGDSPARLAAEQQQAWARFGHLERQQLQSSLADVPANQVSRLQSWLGVTGTRFAARWPDGFIDGLLTCLNAESASRPSDVSALRSRWSKAPPPRVVHALAIKRPEGKVELRFSHTGFPSGLMYMIRRQAGACPRTINDGVEIWKGAIAARIDDTSPQVLLNAKAAQEKGRRTPEAFFYSVFSQDFTDGSISSSAAGPFVILDGSIPHFVRKFAEQLSTTADAGGVGVTPSGELDLLVDLESLPAVTHDLMTSDSVVVRGWGLRLLEQRMQRSPTDQECYDILCQSGLYDASYALRRQSAAILVKYGTGCGVDFVVKTLAPALGGTNLDDRIRAVRGMTEIGLSRSLIEQAIQTFELDRPVRCSQCALFFRAGDIDEHLIDSHGFILLEGEVLPLGEALKRLWGRILHRLEPGAFAELVKHLQQRHAERTLDALRASFRQRFLQLRQESQQHLTATQLTEYLSRLSTCFSTSPMGEELCCYFLVDNEPVINQLGRHFFIRRAAQELAQEETTIATFRQWIEFLVPKDLVNERLQICETLVANGADPHIAQTLRQELELSRITLCPECGESLQVRMLGRHRRTQHSIFEFENQRFSLVGLFTELSNRLVSTESNLFTGITLVELHEEQFGEGAIGKLSDLLFNRIGLLSRTDVNLDLVLACAASSLAPLPIASRLCHHLLKSSSSELIALGLLIFGHLTKCPEIELAKRTASLVGHSDVGPHCRALATAALVRWSANWPEVCRKGLFNYANGVSNDPLERLEALQTLQERTGESSLIQEVSQEQAEKRRIRCPKCAAVLLGSEMPQHALSEHQRIFDGRTLRRPWSVALDTLETYTVHPEPTLLKRGERLAQMEFPEDGLFRFVREALKRGIDPGNYRTVIADAEPSSLTSICPACFEAVPRPLASLTSVRCDSINELHSDFISIHRHSDSLIWISSEINQGDSPWMGPQPGWNLTAVGLISAILATTWLPAIGLMILFGLRHPSLLTIVLGAFGLGLFFSAAALLFYRPRDSHVIDTAWGIVIPYLVDHNKVDGAKEFVAGLCLASVGRGSRGRRFKVLISLQDHFDRLATRGLISEPCLGAIARLRLQDARDVSPTNPEILELLTPLLQRTLSGEQPLSILNLATSEGLFFTTLSAETNVAIRWQILQIAKAQEWTFQDVIHAARHCESLRTVICPSVAAMREKLIDAWALLSILPRHLPNTCRTAIEIVDEGNLQPFAQDLDLLCHSKNRNIRVCSRGIVIDSTCYAVMPSVSVKPLETFVQTGWTHERKDGGPDLRHKHNPAKGYYKKNGFELRLNNKTTHCKSDPTDLANQIRTLSALLFQEIRQRAEELEQQPATFRVEQLFRPRIATCLNCGQLLIHNESRFAEAVVR